MRRTGIRTVSCRSRSWIFPRHSSCRCSSLHIPPRSRCRRGRLSAESCKGSCRCRISFPTALSREGGSGRVISHEYGKMATMAQPMAAANLFTAEVFFIVSVFSIVSVVSVVSIVSIVSVYFVPSVFFIPFVFSPPFISSPLFPCAFCAAWPSGSTELWFLATQLAGFAPPRHPGSQAWPSGPRVLHPVILAPKPSRPVLRVLLPVILASDPGRAVLRVLLSGILVPDPGRAVRWPVALAAALCHIQKTTSQVFGGRKDSE